MKKSRSTSSRLNVCAGLLEWALHPQGSWLSGRLTGRRDHRSWPQLDVRCAINSTQHSTLINDDDRSLRCCYRPVQRRSQSGAYRATPAGWRARHMACPTTSRSSAPQLRDSKSPRKTAASTAAGLRGLRRAASRLRASRGRTPRTARLGAGAQHVQRESRASVSARR